MGIELQKMPEFAIGKRDIIIPETQPTLLHYHNSYELDLFVSSSNHCFLKDVRYEAGNRTLLVIRPNEVHRFDYAPGTQYTRFVINFQESFLSPVLRAQGQEELFEKIEKIPFNLLSLNGKNFNRLLFLFEELWGISKQRNSRALEQSYLLCVFLEIFEIFQDSHPAQVRLTDSAVLVKEIIKYIDRFYQETITLENLAGRFYTNKYHLCHVFKKETNTTILDYLQYKRITQAKELLTTTDRSIVDICYGCGFQSIQNFYRVFKQQVGYTPLQCRKKQE